MASPEQLYVTDREAWRRWLQQHHARRSEVWLVYYKKHTGKPRIPYDDAVEEALCFGWIDSTVRRLDDGRYMQRFTPRKPNSVWSESNKQRVNKMIRERRMTAAGRAAIREAKKNGQWQRAAGSARPGTDAEHTPAELARALARNAKARRFYEGLAPGHRCRYNRWIAEAKHAETRERRAAQCVQRLAKGIKPGI